VAFRPTPPARSWRPLGRIPYIIDPAFHPELRAGIDAAIGNWNARVTALPYLPKGPSDADYAHFKVRAAGTGGSSGIGRGSGENIIWMASDVRPLSIPDQRDYVIHEMAHTAGLIHEHQRPDRDLWILVDLALVEGDLGRNVVLVDGDIVTAYDCSSVVHYAGPGYAGRPPGGCGQLGPTGLSPFDVSALNGWRQLGAAPYLGREVLAMGHWTGETAAVRLHRDGSVWDLRRIGLNPSWRLIGNIRSTRHIAWDGVRLYGARLDRHPGPSTGGVPGNFWSVWSYDGAPLRWRQVGPELESLGAEPEAVRIASDGSRVYLWVDTGLWTIPWSAGATASWQRLDTRPRGRGLTAGPFGVIQLTDEGSVRRGSWFFLLPNFFTGWTEIGPPGVALRQLAGSLDRLYARTATALHRYVGPANQWSAVATPGMSEADLFAADGQWLWCIRPDGSGWAMFDPLTPQPTVPITVHPLGAHGARPTQLVAWGNTAYVLLENGMVWVHEGLPDSVGLV
jgi:hypothetical protein